MSNDLYQRQLEKAQKRLEHSSNCLAGLTKDRNAAVLSKKARKKLYKEYSDSIVKNIASGTDVAVNRKHLEKLAEKHSKHKKDVLQGNCLSAPLLEDVLQKQNLRRKTGVLGSLKHCLKRCLTPCYKTTVPEWKKNRRIR